MPLLDETSIKTAVGGSNVNPVSPLPGLTGNEKSDWSPLNMTNRIFIQSPFKFFSSIKFTLSIQTFPMGRE